MHYFNKYLKLILIAFLTLTLTPIASFAVEDAIIARVNDELITFKDLKDYINAIYVRLSAEGVPEDEVQRIIKELEQTGLSKLVEDRLILSKANTVGIEINNKLVDERIDTLKGRYPTHDAFMDSLVLNGSNMRELRETIMDQLKIQFMIEHAVKSQIEIKPNEVNQYYDENPQFFKKNETINVQSIYIAASGNDELTKVKATAALDLLEQGENFSDISEKYSDAPSIGVVEKGTLRSEMEDIIFGLLEGELSSLVKVDTGFYIFKIKEKTPEEIASLPIVKNKIQDFLYQQKMREQFNTWITKLKEDAYIEIKK